MKKTILIVMTILISSNLFSQTKNAIGVNQQFSKTDTTRTFTVEKLDKDKCFEKMNEVWGKPSSMTLGNIVWTNIDLKGIGAGLTIRVLDGIFSMKENSGNFSPFKSEKNKKKRLGNIQKNEFRYMTIEILDSNKKNIINSIELEKKAVDNLTNLLNTIK